MALNPKPYKRYQIQVSMSEIPYDLVSSSADKWGNDTNARLVRGEAEQIMHTSSTHSNIEDALDYATRVIIESRSLGEDADAGSE